MSASPCRVVLCLDEPVLQLREPGLDVHAIAAQVEIETAKFEGASSYSSFNTLSSRRFQRLFDGSTCITLNTEP
jgi:hypothetical protein